MSDSVVVVLRLFVVALLFAGVAGQCQSGQYGANTQCPCMLKFCCCCASHTSISVVPFLSCAWCVLVVAGATTAACNSPCQTCNFNQYFCACTGLLSFSQFSVVDCFSVLRSFVYRVSCIARLRASFFRAHTNEHTRTHSDPTCGGTTCGNGGTALGSCPSTTCILAALACNETGQSFISCKTCIADQPRWGPACALCPGNVLIGGVYQPCNGRGTCDSTTGVCACAPGSAGPSTLVFSDSLCFHSVVCVFTVSCVVLLSCCLAVAVVVLKFRFSFFVHFIRVSFVLFVLFAFRSFYSCFVRTFVQNASSQTPSHATTTAQRNTQAGALASFNTPV